MYVIKQNRFIQILIITACLSLLFTAGSIALAAEDTEDETPIGSVEKFEEDGNEVIITLSSGAGMKIDLLKQNLFRLHIDPDHEFPELPSPKDESHEATIIEKELDDYLEDYGSIDYTVEDANGSLTISTDIIQLTIDKETAQMSLYNLREDKMLWEEASPISIQDNQTTQTLKTDTNEYFYGGGQQNGYYSHKNKTIDIAVGGGWDAGAASSPSPFFISTNGYGVMRNTFQAGTYDFRSTATFQHKEERYDAYFFVEEDLNDVVHEYHELTGEPAMMPKFGFYLGHLDCFNGTHNGTGEDRTFMGTALPYLEEYQDNDMPLGYFLPNDGYGCGYSGLDNLEEFTDAAKDRGVMTGLWTESNLHPDPSLDEDDPKRRDLNGEVQAGVRAIKTDVAWVGPGYSMALDAVRQTAEGLSSEENSAGARPYIVSLNGWAGTQRYAGLWSGDQTGGNWEYIRMHIPTYIGAGLSGNPNIGSDIDGIFGGDEVIQTRDFQWKTFTPIILDMSGWAGKDNEKNPWNYGEPYTSINRMYLKLKAEMMPYTYSLAAESTKDAMPMVRGMMLEYPDDPYTYGTETQYQYMWGENLLVAPIYKESDHDAEVRNGVYLPDNEQVWIDYFTGEQYTGGGVVNNIDAPLWKTLVFVKDGAIIPMAPEHNAALDLDGSEDRIFEVYPSGNTDFTLYDDDGSSLAYKDGEFLETKITSEQSGDQAVITVNAASGNGFANMVTERGTQFIVNVSEEPEALTAQIANDDVALTEVDSLEALEQTENAYFYDEAPNLNKYATEGSDFAETEIITTPKLHVKLEKTNITANDVQLTVDGFTNEAIDEVTDEEAPTTPENFTANEDEITDDSIPMTWDAVEGESITYDIEIDGVLHRNVYKQKEDEQPHFTHGDLESDTTYNYKVRAVNSFGASEWSEELEATTSLDRFRNVPKDITAKASSNQSGSEADKAVDGDEGTGWHTDWNDGNELPHTFDIDMKLAYALDKFEYVPRHDAGNGTILKYDLDISFDGKSYKNIITDGEFERSGDVKTINFDDKVEARYIRLTITDAVGGFGSAQEFRPYKKDGSSGWVAGKNIPDGENGEINDDDLRFFDSYLGVDTTDSAWDQVRLGDVNYDGVIDGYDLMFISSHFGDKQLEPTREDVAGKLDVRPSVKEVEAGETFTVDIVGSNLNDINAFSLELTADTSKYKLKRVTQADGIEHMHHRSKRHGDRIMVASSNLGQDETINGDLILATIELEARKDTTFDGDITRSMLINTNFDTIEELGGVLDPDEEPEGPEEPEEPEEPEDEPREVVILTADDLTISGDADKLQNGEDAFDALVDGDLNTLTEMLWDIDGQDTAELPVTFNMEFNELQALTQFEVFNRTSGENGHIKSFKASVIGEDDTEYNLGIIEMDEGQESVVVPIAEQVETLAEDAETIPDHTTFKSLHLTFEESYVGHPTMLSIAEIEISALESVDQTKLAALIDEAEAIDTDGYSSESVSIFEEKLADAKATLENTMANQDTIDRATKALQDAIDGLEAINTDSLQKAIEKAKEVDLTKYTKESQEALEEALKEAEEVMEDANATAEEIKDVETALLAAIDNLVPLASQAEKDKLEALIKDARAIDTDDYTEQSVTALNKALEQAKAIGEDANASEAAVAMALEELQAALDNLKEKEDEAEKEDPDKVDKRKLEKKVKEAKAIDQALYTKNSLRTFQEKLHAAQAILEDEEASQTAIDDALADLEAAIKQLEKVKSEPSTPGEGDQKDPKPKPKPKPGEGGNDGTNPSTNDDKGDGKELPKTATNMFNGLLAGIALLVIGGVLLFIRRRQAA